MAMVMAMAAMAMAAMAMAVMAMAVMAMAVMAMAVPGRVFALPGCCLYQHGRVIRRVDERRQRLLEHNCNHSHGVLGKDLRSALGAQPAMECHGEGQGPLQPLERASIGSAPHPRVKARVQIDGSEENAIAQFEKVWHKGDVEAVGVVSHGHNQNGAAKDFSMSDFAGFVDIVGHQHPAQAQTDAAAREPREG